MEALAGWPSPIPSALPAASLPATTSPLYLSSLRLLTPQPKALHTHGDKYHLRRHPPTPAPEERELRGGFPSHRPPRSYSVHLSVTLIILPFAPFFQAAFLIPRVWTRRWDLGSLQPAVLSGHGCKAPGRRLESLCHSLQWNCMSEIHLNHVHVPHMLPATCPHHNSSFIPF